MASIGREPPKQRASQYMDAGTLGDVVLSGKTLTEARGFWLKKNYTSHRT